MDESRSVMLYLVDILEFIEKIEEYVKGVQAIDFFSNQEKQDAVIRRIEIIGEATKKIPLEIRQSYPDVPWKQIMAMRNIAIHHYFGVSPELIWQVAIQDAAELKPVIQQLIKLVTK
jgi:uncharacterized protein with HEPN domain